MPFKKFRAQPGGRCDSLVSIATRLGTGQSGFWGSIPSGVWEFFSSPLSITALGPT